MKANTNIQFKNYSLYQCPGNETDPELESWIMRGKCCMTETKSKRNGKNTAQISLAETMPRDDMKKGPEETKELEAVIRAAVMRLKCGYSL